MQLYNLIAVIIKLNSYIEFCSSKCLFSLPSKSSFKSFGRTKGIGNYKVKTRRRQKGINHLRQKVLFSPSEGKQRLTTFARIAQWNFNKSYLFPRAGIEKEKESRKTFKEIQSSNEVQREKMNARGYSIGLLHRDPSNTHIIKNLRMRFSKLLSVGSILLLLLSIGVLPFANIKHFWNDLSEMNCIYCWWFH